MNKGAIVKQAGARPKYRHKYKRASHALGLTASTVDGKHVRVSKILLTPACLTIAPMSIHHGTSGLEGGSVIIENALLSDQSVSHVSSELTSTMEQSNVVRTHEFTARDRCIHTSGTTRFCTSLGAGFGANGRCHEACKARQSTQHTPGHHILPLARPQTTTRPISAPTASRCF